MTSEEMGVHVLYIRKSVDELKNSESKQWERLNEHSQKVAVLESQYIEHEKKATKNGILGGLGSGLSVLALKELVVKLLRL